MNDGKVAQVGRPEDLYDRPCNRFVAGFIGESNFLPAVVRDLEDDIVVAECEGVLVRALCPARPANGTKVTLTTRPERLRFADTLNGHAPQNRMRELPNSHPTVICIGSPGTANLVPSLFEAFYETDKPAQLVLEHQSGSKPDQIYLRVFVGNSKWHLFARIAIRRL